MRIEKIILNNFRIYKGKNVVRFKHNESKNVSIIAGKNGFGKTTFLTSLIWAFYGGLMSQVEDKYKKDIKSSGGYEQFVHSLLNKDVLHKFRLSKSELASFSVEIHLVDVLIPSVPCKKVVVNRGFDFKSNKENLSILIDGHENELTKEVGYDVFINDFILPREIAKFFFFDAEKIVGLAEAKSKSELRTLSKAYSEVLGIKKYEDLRVSLKTMLSKLRRNGVSELEQSKLDSLLKLESDFNELVNHNNEKLQDLLNDIEACSIKSDNIQEQLIREGSHVTLEELKELKEEKRRLKTEHDLSKAELKKLLDLYPVVLASDKYVDFVNQVKFEAKQNEQGINEEFMRKEMTSFVNELLTIVTDKRTLNDINKASKKIIENKYRFKTNSDNSKILLDFSDVETREIENTFMHVKDTFSETFNRIVKTEKENRLAYNRVVNKIKVAEARKSNPLAIALREEKESLDDKIKELQSQRDSLFVSQAEINVKRATNQKVLSEFEKNFKIKELDKGKYNVAQILLEKLDLMIVKIKEEKKYSLQKSVLLGLKRMMHKNDLITDVKVRIENDIMDIDLFDVSGNVIDKDSLSKGEQQLYATALLKALVDESGIDFPVFIDSPLQKFDKEHSQNVIKQFYPSVSKQVVLFPLLEKELSEKEFEEMKPSLSSAYLIKNNSIKSTIEETPIEHLFASFNKQNQVAQV